MYYLSKQSESIVLPVTFSISSSCIGVLPFDCTPLQFAHLLEHEIFQIFKIHVVGKYIMHARAICFTRGQTCKSSRISARRTTKEKKKKKK